MTSQTKEKLRGMLKLLDNKILKTVAEWSAGILVGVCLVLGMGLLFIMGE